MPHNLSIFRSPFLPPSARYYYYNFDYLYDNLYRITSSIGFFRNFRPLLPFSPKRKKLYADYMLSMQYMADGRITQKNCSGKTLVNGSNSAFSHNYNYTYDNSHQVRSVDGNEYRWDDNGNLQLIQSIGNAGVIHSEFEWDEENRMRHVDMPNAYQCAYYQYDASGERYYKNVGTRTESVQNGQTTVYRQYEEPVLYASPYLVATPEGYTKHYFVESERIASRIGEGIIFGINSHAVSDSQLAAKRSLVNQTAPRKVRPEMFRFLYTLTENWSASHTTYWQHSDHLGSANWVTDTAGTGYQFLLYMPWGEPFVDLRKAHSSYNTRYTFSGKERDEETGFSYFGARHYNSDLSIWLSVDPMSDKYPSTSPYTYCGNNPVKLVDPNGREIWIVGEDGNKYQYFNGKLYTSDGEVCHVVEGSFEESALNNLDVLRSTKTGGRIIRDLETCAEKVTIVNANERTDKPGKDAFIQTGRIAWNPNGGGEVQTTRGKRNDAITNLGHELVHAHDKYVENLSFAELNMTIDHCPLGEWRAVYYENRMRKELGMPYRTGYTTQQEHKGTTFPYFTRMLDSFDHPYKIW